MLLLSFIAGFIVGAVVVNTIWWKWGPVQQDCLECEDEYGGIGEA